MTSSRSRDAEYTARKKKIITIVAAALLVLALVLFQVFVPLKTLLPPYALPPREEGEMRVHFLGVGQGDCTLVEFPEGDVLIVDAGDGAFDTENMLVRYLKGLDPTAVTVVATHADVDHYGGFTELIQYFGAEKVYLPVLDSSVGAYQRFAAAVKSSGAEVETLARYSVISKSSGAYCVCISPNSLGETDENDASAVLYINYGGVGVLLGGDISAAREETLAAEYALIEGIFDSGDYAVRLEDTAVLKVSHHGSADASSKEWLSLLSPEVAIVSCGRGNLYSHPAGESLARLKEAGAEIYRTDELGNIVVSIKNGNYTILE